MGLRGWDFPELGPMGKRAWEPDTEQRPGGGRD